MIKTAKKKLFNSIPDSEVYLVELLKVARRSSGLKQEGVAKKMGTYASFISKVENGDRKVTINEFLQMCKIYNVAPEALISEIFKKFY